MQPQLRITDLAVGTLPYLNHLRQGTSCVEVSLAKLGTKSPDSMEHAQGICSDAHTEFARGPGTGSGHARLGTATDTQNP